MKLEQLLEEIDRDELEYRVRSRPQPTTDREFRCPVCHHRCTRLLDGHSEAGHERHCPRRMQRTGAERVAPMMTDGGEVER